MKQTKILMGMPITIEILDAQADEEIFNLAFSYFKYVDEKFSTYKSTSEIEKINNHQLSAAEWSDDMRAVMRLCEETKRVTNGYFNIVRHGRFDPSGLVKGWAIYNVAQKIRAAGFKNFYVDAGGDIEVAGVNVNGQAWRVGIQDPFQTGQIIKTVYIKDGGVATSGTYIRGNHIYNPNGDQSLLDNIVSLTVIGPTIYDADRFATAAYAMGKAGIQFIEALPGFEGYMIDQHGIATFTSGFQNYTHEL